MQMAITFLAVVGGLAFSLAIALLAEEIIFGQVFRLIFAPAKLACGADTPARVLAVSKEPVPDSIAVKSAQKC
jgi:ABC-type enterobactin transport system permease subunit